MSGDITYKQAYYNSLNDKEVFWQKQAKKLHWFEECKRILDERDSPHNMWFVGGKCNVCYNAVDRHVDEGRGDIEALIYDSAMTGTKTRISYYELKKLVSKTAGILRNCGVAKGDRVVIYMPMIPEAVLAMLACARIGAVHSVVFGGFVADELANRIKDSEAKLLLTASVGFEPGKTIDYVSIVDSAIEKGNSYGQTVDSVVVVQREGHEAELESRGYLDWQTMFDEAEEQECVAVESTHPLYILYTSGSTGTPKGIERACGAHMVALSWSMEYIYNCGAGEVFWAASDLGWIVGHSYIVYAPLLAGCTTVVYEGKPVRTPDSGAFFRVIEEHKVKTMFTAPTAFRAIRREDPEGKFLEKYDISSLRSQFLAGERCDIGTVMWLEKLLKVPVIDHWWQTETGWAITGSFLGFSSEEPIKEGSSGLPVPGYDLRILDENSQEVKTGDMGDVCIKLPMPPSFMSGLWRGRERFVETYMQKHVGYYTTGDAGFFDEDGYCFIMSRVDDVINVAGHRIATSAIEESLISHPKIVEAAAVGVNDQLKGQMPVALVVSSQIESQEQKKILEKELVNYVRENMGAVISLHTVHIVELLPKTRSGKILRGTIQKILNKQPYKISPTIENVKAIDEVESLVKN